MYPSDTTLLPDKGQIVVWGDDTFQQIKDTPPGTNFTKIVPGGAQHSLAIRKDGTLKLWGGVGVTDPIPTPNPGDQYIAAAIGITHAIAIRKSDGVIVPYGKFALGGLPTPPPELTGLYPSAVAVGGGFCLAIANFKIYQWGAGKGTQPQGGPFIMVGARNDYCLALREDGALYGWGGSLFPAVTAAPGVPAAFDNLPRVYLEDWTRENGHYVHRGPFVAMAAGSVQRDRPSHIPHVLALKADGTVIGWGSDAHGEITKVPPGVRFKAIAAGLGYSLGLDDAGYIHHWGDAGTRQVTMTGGGGRGVGAWANVPKGRFASIGATTRHAAAVAASNVPSAVEP